MFKIKFIMNIPAVVSPQCDVFLNIWEHRKSLVYHGAEIKMC